MKAAIVSIGSEILAGELLDTNSQYIAQELTHLGVDVVLIAQTRDDQSQIVSILRHATTLADLIVTSGGLGPTADDLTREAIAELAGEVPFVDEETLDTVRRIFASRGQTMPERNAKQAWTIGSAQIIENRNGTAPGWLVRLPEGTIVALPGPPRENRRMWHGPVLDVLRPSLGARNIKSRTIKTIGIGESSVEDALEDIVRRSDPVTATYAKADGVHIRITATGDDRRAVESIVEATVQDVKERIGEHIYGFDDDSLAAAVTRRLRVEGETLAICEHATAGRIANLLLSDQASGRVIRGSTIHHLEVGGEVANSDPAAMAFEAARHSRLEHESDWGLGVVICAADANTVTRTDASIGIALASPSNTVSTIRSIHAYPDEIRRRSMLWTAEFLWSQFRAGESEHRKSSAAESAPS